MNIIHPDGNLLDFPGEFIVDSFTFGP